VSRLLERIAPLLGLTLALCASGAGADQGPPAEPGIQDNSFLIEEAYNQDFGVVQHISSWQRGLDSGSWVYTFTQEWPVPGPRHQLSYTIPLLRLAGEGTKFGDVALNYRFQLAGDADSRVAAAPRLSLSLPTGESGRGFGLGHFGVQVSLPVSVVLRPRLVTHFNLGAVVTPSAKNARGDQAGLFTYDLGASAIFLAHPRFNVMLEALYVDAESVAGPERTERTRILFLSPGIRGAFNFASGLQIVPGLAFPFQLGPDRTENAVLLYLSFEHPFRKRP